ncbi:MAG: hypothetical protein ABSG09_01940, partial [Acidimicrobiales bacterium]
MISLRRRGRVSQLGVTVTALAVVIMVPLTIMGPLGAGVADAGQGTLTVSGQETDALVNPVGINDLTPTLSWNDIDSVNSATQTGYEIQAASSVAVLSSGSGLLWDSGEVLSASQS